MITFHPTIPFRTYIRRLITRPHDPEPRLSALFPGHSITLTDSGRSALALIIETLNLEHKRMALPAFLCNNILPVLKHYNIEPVFLDIDPLTYQPAESAYETPCDAALIVATYGKLPNPSIIQSLRNRGTIVIEDWAHVALPTTPIDRIDGDARYYSLSKTLPVPDGGLAIIPKGHVSGSTLGHPHTTFTSIKDVKKLMPFAATTIALARFFFSQNKVASHPPAWHGLAHLRRISRRFLGHALASQNERSSAYCHPIRVNDLRTAQGRLFKNNIIAEPLWNHPIIEATEIDRSQFPNTIEAAQHTLCVPLWHVRTGNDTRAYEQKLKDALPDEFRGFGEEAGGNELP